jgi:hypothetical protein
VLGYGLEIVGVVGMYWEIFYCWSGGYVLGDIFFCSTNFSNMIHYLSNEQYFFLNFLFYKIRYLKIGRAGNL